jgi:hypothetical protein
LPDRPRSPRDAGSWQPGSVEFAYALAQRCARIAVTLAKQEQEWERLGHRWHALDVTRRNREAVIVRQAYVEQGRRVYAARKATHAAFRDLRAVQDGWTQADWERYRDLLESRMEAGDAPWQAPEALAIASRSAEAPRVRMPGLLRRVYQSVVRRGRP